jgi:putative phage-type endonuclease
MKIIDVAQGSPEWLALRRKYATASEMAAILKVKGAYGSRKKLLESKSSGEEKQRDEYTTAMFARGHEIEAELRVWAEAKLGMKFEPCVLLDEELGILASIDCVNFEHGVIIETKNSWAKGKLEMARNYEVWEPYRVQILAQMLVAKIDLAFMCMRDDVSGEIHLIAVEPDENTTCKIIEESAKFNNELRETL